MHTYQDNSLAATHTKYGAFHGTEGHPQTKLKLSRHTVTSARPILCSALQQVHIKSIKSLDGQAHLSGNPPQQLGTTMKCALSASHAKLLLLSLVLLSLGIECRLLSHGPVSV